MSAPADPQSPFARVPSRRAKLGTLMAFVALTCLCASFPLFAEVTLKSLQTWLALYGVAFFGLMSVHSWRSIRYNWSIQEDNDASRGALAILQSFWMMLAVAALWLLAHFALP